MRINLQFFGGRGAGSSGGGTGGVNPADIVETESLLSASGKTPEINQVMQSVKDVYDKYGKTLTDIQLATMKGKGSLTMAYYDSNGNLAINKAYFDSKTMTKAYDECVKKGFHPSRGNKTGLEAVSYHELGHKLTEDAGRKMGLGDWQLDKASNTIMKNAKKSLGKMSIDAMRKAVSGYAKTNNAEAIAEAFADVQCNGKKASKVSQAIVKELEKYL